MFCILAAHAEYADIEDAMHAGPARHAGDAMHAKHEGLQGR